jgi:adenylate cyclase
MQHVHIPQRRNFGVVVCDLRGFTALTERYEPLRVVELLNNFFQVMVRVIHAHNGVTDKFMGDSVLAFFDTKEAPDTPERMLTCMLRMQLAMDEVNDWAKAHQLPNLFMGIGGTYGQATLCELGSPLYREVTVLGDTVNLAARITAFCLRGQILISELLYAQVEEKVVLGLTNDVHFKGKREAVRIYEVLGQTPPDPILLPVREQRRHYRVDVDLGTSFLPVLGKELAHQPVHARTVNISRSGLRMITAEPLETGTEMKMQLPFLPDADQSEVYARVVSCKEEIDGTFTPCVEFTYLDEDTSKALGIFVDRLV